MGDYAIKGFEDHEDYGRRPFDWDGYYVATDLMEKPADYDDVDHYEGRHYYEDRYRVHYVETE